MVVLGGGAFPCEQGTPVGLLRRDPECLEQAFGFQDFRTENGPNEGHNLALTVLMCAGFSTLNPNA